MTSHPLNDRPAGPTCRLTLDEQVRLPLTGKKKVEYLVAVKNGQVVKGQMRQLASYPDEIKQARVLRSLANKNSEIFSAVLEGVDFTNWRLLLPPSASK